MTHAPKIPTHLRADLSDDMYRTEMWLKANVNPIDGHKLITSAQSAHLLEKRMQLLASGLSPRECWQEFSGYAQNYLAQLNEAERRPQIVQELNETIRPEKPFSQYIFLTAEEFSREYHRSGGFREKIRTTTVPRETPAHAPSGTKPRPPKPEKPAATVRQPRIKVDGEALDKTWHNLASSYGITAAHAGAAARKLRSDEPFAPNSVNQQRFLLRKQGVVSPFFQYIHRQPEAFFSALEAQIGKPIALSDRQPLLDQLAAASAASRPAHSR